MQSKKKKNMELQTSGRCRQYGVCKVHNSLKMQCVTSILKQSYCLKATSFNVQVINQALWPPLKLQNKRLLIWQNPYSGSPSFRVQGNRLRWNEINISYQAPVISNISGQVTCRPIEAPDPHPCQPGMRPVQKKAPRAHTVPRSYV